MSFIILFLLHLLRFNYVHLLISRKSIYNFQNMNPLNIQSLKDVKEKVRYDKNCYCLVVNKYRVNEILKNNYIKFWLLNIYKFPSVLKFNDYKGSFSKDHNRGEDILAFIQAYMENLQRSRDEEEAKMQVVHQDSTNGLPLTVHENTTHTDEADHRLIPLNDYFNRIIEELFISKNNAKDVNPVLIDYISFKEGKAKNGKDNRDEVNNNRRIGFSKHNGESVHEGENQNVETHFDSVLDEEDRNMEYIYNANKQKYIQELFKLVEKENMKLKMVTLHFGYENMNTSEILRKIFPSINEIIHKFEIIGHIAHLNFCGKLENYKKIIAQVILDKNKCIKTVINKKDMLNNIHRTFTIELLAGEKNYITQLKENKINVKINYELIYWNSKLKKERDRIYNLVEKNSIILDVFGGVGIFSLLLSKKCCLCFSNDINKHAYNYMNINIELNKARNILTYNLDGRDFLRMVFRLNIFSKKNFLLTMNIDEQNRKNISQDVINSTDHDIFDKKKKKRKKEDVRSQNCEIGEPNNLVDTNNRGGSYRSLKNEKKFDEHIGSSSTTKCSGSIGMHKCIVHKENYHTEEIPVLNSSKNDNYKRIKNATASEVSNDMCIDVQKKKQVNDIIDSSSECSTSSAFVLGNKNDTTVSEEESYRVDINLSIYKDIHILMNLPQTALEFLDVFKNLKKEKEKDQVRNIYIHCYYFSKPEFFYEHAEKNILLHFQALPHEMKITEIRKVSPGKLMYVVEFNLKNLLTN
ncbi:met-10+ like protein, putative [Plasmodium malariae]|uniref:tRNA (guanine(37)-N1)-methyltransferase n=1 Tax=Plasmodium malariae TaxID=5858 RepID=A0A1D3JMA5_PLAMA|nr:met-10+ like protein, putative [Plasmodium malariae]SBT87797.1 met-10+ like protein, putative [Plasmodium malariae]